MNLIQTLMKMSDLTPDEIAAQLQNGGWTRMDKFTREQYQYHQRADNTFVLFYHNLGSDKMEDCGGEYRLHSWSFSELSNMKKYYAKLENKWSKGDVPDKQA